MYIPTTGRNLPYPRNLVSSIASYGGEEVPADWQAPPDFEDVITSLFSTLEPEERQLLFLYYKQKWSLHSISANFRTSDKAVKERIADAEAKLALSTYIHFLKNGFSQKIDPQDVPIFNPGSKDYDMQLKVILTDMCNDRELRYSMPNASLDRKMAPQIVKKGCGLWRIICNERTWDDQYMLFYNSCMVAEWKSECGADDVEYHLVEGIIPIATTVFKHMVSQAVVDLEATRALQGQRGGNNG